MSKCLKYFFLLISVSLSIRAMAQNVLNVVESTPTETLSSEIPELYTERIQRISDSKRIFILSYDSKGFHKGDFVSLLLNKNLAARAVVAKTTAENAGIKILKIYSLPIWAKLGKGVEVQIVRGDDSYFMRRPEDKKEKSEAEEAESKLLTEEDVYGLSSDGAEINENKKRVIKTDNIVGASYGQISALDGDGNSEFYVHWSAHWAYQVADNIWAQALYGRSVMTDFPSSGLDTVLTNITLRLKYVFAAPFYSYIKPYVGYQMISASSPDAGVAGDDTSLTQAQLDNEVALVDDLEENKLVFGVTLLKRLVPGWFVKADLGTDQLNLGFVLEF